METCSFIDGVALFVALINSYKYDRDTNSALWKKIFLERVSKIAKRKIFGRMSLTYLPKGNAYVQFIFFSSLD